MTILIIILCLFSLLLVGVPVAFAGQHRFRNAHYWRIFTVNGTTGGPLDA